MSEHFADHFADLTAEAERTGEFAKALGLSGFIRAATEEERAATGVRFQPIEETP